MTAGRKVHSNNQNWCTPPKYAKAIEQFFGIVDLDPCSNNYSIINATVKYLLPLQDGLSLSWNFKKIYCNPPYGKDWNTGTTIKDWLRKCSTAYENYDSEVLALIPVATNTQHWKSYVWSTGTGICFLSDTRLKFLQDGILSAKGAPMPCAMIYWGKNFSKFKETFKTYGAVVKIDET